MYREDTIAAISTPPGEGGIGIVRISGPDAEGIIQKIFVDKNGKTHREYKNRYFYYGKILDEEKRVIDEVLVVIMRAPHSYTMEDVAEIHCHGGMIPVRKILKLVLNHGARLAEPGEFSKRAFLNGRIDLAQAEAIMDLISAKSESAAWLSVHQMEGKLSGKIKNLREKILNLLAHVEVTIDYPEEEIESDLLDHFRENMDEVLKEITKLLDTAEQGKLIRDGIKTVIIGKPNVGKSSLLNALVRENRAIVTDIPGTTRDVIEEYINIKGVTVRIVDTAGIRETLDLVEKIGVERSKESVQDADLVILMLDASRPLEEEDRKILRLIGDRKTLILLNKVDQPSVLDREKITELMPDKIVIETSLISGKGIEEVEDFIYNMVYSGSITPNTDILVGNLRHQEALIKAKNHLKDALLALDQAVPLDLISIDIRGALEALGTITGDDITEDLVDKIFSEFCLGK